MHTNCFFLEAFSVALPGESHSHNTYVCPDTVYHEDEWELVTAAMPTWHPHGRFRRHIRSVRIL